MGVGEIEDTIDNGRMFDTSLNSPSRVESKGMLPLETQTMLDNAKGIRPCCH